MKMDDRTNSDEENRLLSSLFVHLVRVDKANGLMTPKIQLNQINLPHGRHAAMAELLTTKQLQQILKVDRTTIYRMAESGRIPAIKVGNQWRFSRQQIEAWLWKRNVETAGAEAQPATPAQPATTAPMDVMPAHLLPLESVQMIQDAYAELLNVMLVVTDLDGAMITRPSNVVGLFTATESSPKAHQRCLEHWIAMAGNPRLQPIFQRSHLGLLCARGLIRVGPEIKAMLIVGGIAPDDWPPDDAVIQEIADDLFVEPAIIKDHADEVHRADAQRQKEILPYVQRIADIFSLMATERYSLLQRLYKIYQLAKV